MTQHKHYDMICAKAANMELVVFHNARNPDEWSENLENVFPAFREDWDYFLCLPKHKEAVFNCLNGGDSQVSDSESPKWRHASTCGHSTWHAEGWWYMMDDRESRIKPHKQKRWIAFTIEEDEMLCREKTFDSRDEAIDFFGPFGFQYIEVEV